MAVPAARSFRTFSLRAHLLLLVIGTTLPVLLVAGALIQRVIADDRAAVERQLIEAARAQAAIVDSELEGTIRALQGLSQSDSLTDRQLPEVYAQAQRLLTTQPTWTAVSLSTPDGQQIANTTTPLGDPLPFVTDPPSFERSANARLPSIGNLRLGSVSHQLGFPVRVPVIRNGVVLYVLSAWLTSTNFSNVLPRQPTLSDEWSRGVVDADGVLVTRSKDAERFVGQKGTQGFLERLKTADEAVYQDVALDGTPVYGAFSRAPKSRWIAGVAVPASAVNASFQSSMIALGAVALLLLAFGGGGTYLLSRRMSREISESATEAEAIAAGLHPTQPRSRVTEVQRLLEALARSATLLDAHQRERDEQVARADAARAEAEAADRAKDQFLAMLGHELRNPLAPALTALHLMKLRNSADTTHERDVIERQIRHMARLVDDLLDVSRLRRGAIELRREPFELADAVARAVEMTTPLFTDKDHHFNVDVSGGLVINADRIRIAQVLSNLLSNAAKYTEPGGHVVLRAREQHGQVVVECRDNGMGIAPDLVPRIFDLFVQGPRGLDRRQGGLGLGLALARTLVELHGGTIEARSAGTNQGSTFIVRLPMTAAPITAKAVPQYVPQMPAVQVAIGRVMVVDDNRDALDTLLEALKEAGLEAFGASTGREALDLAARINPQVAVLDIGLPEMDGFDLARALRSFAHGTSIRLIALTGYGREQDLAAAKAAGFDGFLVKPVDIPVLLDALSQPVA